MTTPLAPRRVPALALSRRETATLLRIDRSSTLDKLIEAGFLRLVPWGKGWRIPREGWNLNGLRSRGAPRSRSTQCDPDSLRRVDVRALGGKAGA